MTRNEQLASSFSRSMALIEIGASYNPIVPKSDGWNTTVIDHANRSELIKKYHDQQIANIEDVDIIWRDGALADAVPAHLYGTFDALIASHVGEHIPDLIGFFQSVAMLLKPAGMMFLALPDKRLCFDFFKPLTTTGDLLDGLGRVRHTTGTLFNHSAYFAVPGWSDGVARWWCKSSPFKLSEPFEAARALLSADRQRQVHKLARMVFHAAQFSAFGSRIEYTRGSFRGLLHA